MYIDIYLNERMKLFKKKKKQFYNRVTNTLIEMLKVDHNLVSSF